MLKRLCNKLKVQPKGQEGGTLTHKNVPLALDHSAASAPAARPSLQFSHFDEDTKRFSRPSQKEILRGQYRGHLLSLTIADPTTAVLTIADPTTAVFGLQRVKGKWHIFMS